MRGILEDLTHLPPKKLAKRLGVLAREALPCVAVNVFDGNPQDGLTVGLWVEAQGRRDVIDLARVLQTEPGGHVSSGWSLLAPDRQHHYHRLLLRVMFERPVLCSFGIRFDVRDQPEDRVRKELTLLLAASGLALGFDALPVPGDPATWIPAPASSACVLNALAAVAP